MTTQETQIAPRLNFDIGLRKNTLENSHFATSRCFEKMKDDASMTSSPISRFSPSRNGRPGMNVRAISVAACLALVAACSSPEEKVERYTNSGLEFIEEEEWNKANIQFQNALKINEEHVPALVGVAKVAENKQNYKRMFGALQSVVRLDPENQEALVQLGKLFLVGSDENQALEFADRALAVDANNAEALALKAAVMIKIDDGVQAIELAKKSLEIDPSNAEATTVLATERARAKDYEGALEYIDGALSENSNQAALHLFRLQMLKNLGREDDVTAGYLRLIDEFPENVGYRRIYVTALIAKNELAEARAQLVEVANILSKEVDPVLDVVRVDYRVGGEPAARETFAAYVAERPDDIELSLAFASHLRTQGAYEEAEEIYSSLIDKKNEPETQIRAKNELAGQRLLEGKTEEAETLVLEILELDERNSGAMLKLAGLKIDRNELDEAIRDLRVVLNDDPQSAPARMLMASAFEKQGDVALASSQMAQAIEESEYDSKQSNVFAKFLIRNNEQTRAENVLVQSLDKFPNDSDNLKFLAAIRLAKQDWKGAEEAAKALEGLNEQDPIVNRILGAAYAGLEDYSGVIETLESENRRAPLVAQPLEVLVDAYLRSGQAVKAEELLRENISNNTESSTASFLLARVLLAQQRTEEARQTLTNAIETREFEYGLYEALYRIHVREGQLNEANALIERGLSVAPDNDGLKFIKADSLLAAGKDEEALSLYEDILSRRPNDRLVANNYASLLTQMRDDPDSRRKAVSVAEVLDGVENAFFQDTYGWALVRNGELDRGLELLEKAALSAPGNAEIQYHLGAALLQKGETVRGKEVLEKSIGLAADGANFLDEANRLITQ